MNWLKRILAACFAFVLFFSVASSGYAVIKGFEGESPSMVKVGESVVVPPGAVVESAVAVGGSATIYGRVLEDVVAVGGPVTLKSSAVVNGNAVSIGGKVLKDAGATLKGNSVEVALAAISPAFAMMSNGNMMRAMAIFSLLSFIGFIVLTMVLVALFTPQLGKISGGIEKEFWKSLLWGLLILVILVPVAIILAVSIVGIPLIPVWIILVAVAGLFGYLAAAHVIGKKILKAFKVTGRSMMIETLTGVVLLTLLDFIPVLGSLVKMIAMVCGLGAATRTKIGNS